MQKLSREPAQRFTTSDLYRRRFRAAAPPRRTPIERLALRALTVCAGVVLVAAGVPKFAPHSSQVELYVRAGFPAFTLWVVGALEVIAGLWALASLARSSVHLVTGAVRRARVDSASAPAPRLTAAGRSI